MERAVEEAIRTAHWNSNAPRGRLAAGAIAAGTAAAAMAQNAIKRAWIETKWQARMLPQMFIRDTARTGRQALQQPIRALTGSRYSMPYKRSYKSYGGRRTFKKRSFKRRPKRYTRVKYTKRQAFYKVGSRYASSSSKKSNPRLQKTKVSRAFRNLRFVSLTS